MEDTSIFFLKKSWTVACQKHHQSYFQIFGWHPSVRTQVPNKNDITDLRFRHPPSSSKSPILRPPSAPPCIPKFTGFIENAFLCEKKTDMLQKSTACGLALGSENAWRFRQDIPSAAQCGQRLWKETRLYALVTAANAGLNGHFSIYWSEAGSVELMARRSRAGASFLSVSQSMS